MNIHRLMNGRITLAKQKSLISHTIVFSILFMLTIPLMLRNLYAQELLLSKDQMQKLEKNSNVSLAKILDNGQMIMVSETTGGSARILLVASKGFLIRSVKTPITKIDYITCSDDGKKAIIYCNDEFEFFLVDIARGNCRSIFRKEPGKTGFALYGKKESWIDFSGNDIYALGYYYDNEDNYISENIVRILPDRRGLAVFEPVAEMARLMEGAKAFYPSAKKYGAFQVMGDYLLFTSGDENGGCFLAYNMKDETLTKISDFSSFNGLATYPRKSLLAYAIRKSKDPGNPGELIIYDLAEKKRIKSFSGRYFLPSFDPLGENLATALLVPIISGRYITRIQIFPIAGSEDAKPTQEILPDFRPIDIKFVKNGKEIYIFTGENVYKCRL